MGWGAIFPGQGSQQIMMGHYLYENFSLARVRFEEANDTIHVDFKKLCFSEDEAALQLTHNTQPALLLVSAVTYEVFHSLTGFTPLASAGHSVGEYAALVATKAIPFAAAIAAVRKRGEAMQNAVPVGEGGMCAVLGLSNEQTQEVCNWVLKESKLGPIEPANFNSPGQVVVSGCAKAIDWLVQNFKKEALKEAPSRAKFIPLKVSAPFHCSLMKPAEDVMREHLSNIPFFKPTNPIVQNFTAKPSEDPTEIKENLIRQITGPVLWTQCVQALNHIGIDRFIEFGSGKVLAGLNKKIDSENLQTFNLNTLEELKLLEGLYATQR